MKCKRRKKTLKINELVQLHRNTKSTDRLMEAIFSSFIRTISPLLATPPPEGSVSLMMHLGEKTIFEALANLDNILPILLSITRNSLQVKILIHCK